MTHFSRFMRRNLAAFVVPLGVLLAAVVVIVPGAVLGLAVRYLAGENRMPLLAPNGDAGVWLPLGLFSWWGLLLLFGLVWLLYHNWKETA